MAYLALDAVSAALYAVLNVSGLTALATGGISDGIGQKKAYPFLLYVVNENSAGSGLGTKPGQSLLLEVDIRLHVFSQESGLKSAQAVMKKAIELLSATDALRSSLASNGYRLCGGEPLYDDTVALGNAIVAGENVQELVSNFRLYVEEA
jgi:hypothetical protein